MRAPSLSQIRRPGLPGAAVVAGVAGSAALALSFGSTLSAYTATITNPTNTSASETLAVTETSGAATCNSYDTTTSCTTINKYGGTATPLAPGQASTVSVKFTNVGGIAAGSATLAPGTCTATKGAATGSTTPTTPNTSAGNLCSQLNLQIFPAATATGTPIYTGSLSGFSANVALGSLAKAGTKDYTFVLTLPQAAGNEIQGQQVSQPLVWTFNQV